MSTAVNIFMLCVHDTMWESMMGTEISSGLDFTPLGQFWGGGLKISEKMLRIFWGGVREGAGWMCMTVGVRGVEASMEEKHQALGTVMSWGNLDLLASEQILSGT